MERKFLVDEVYQAVFVTFGTRFARALTWIDRRIVDGAVMGSGTAALATGRLARRAQTGMVRTYVAVMVIAIALLLAVAVGMVR
jgi:NADH-quinone oxidoreductase subunit L